MNVNVKYIKDENGKIFSPITSISSVVSKEGGSLLDFFYPVGTYYETSSEDFDPNIAWRRRMDKRHYRFSYSGCV